MKRIGIVLACSLLLLATAVLADTLHLKDGRTFEGKLVSDSGGVVKFRTFGGVLEFKKSDVDSIDRGMTKADEYKARLEKIAEDDIAALYELAEWCAEQKLVSQKAKVLRKILAKCPDHPETRRLKRQIHKDGKWVKAPKNLAVTTVSAGESRKVPGTRASLKLPRGWAAEDAENRCKAEGPALYAFAPVLTAEFGLPAGSDPFPEEAGWAKPEEVSAGGTVGRKSRRPISEGAIARVEWLAVLAQGSEKQVRIRLVALRMEEKTFAPAFELALRSLAFEAPPADYVNKHYDYALNLPKPKSEWTHGEDEVFDLWISHEGTGDTDYATLWVVTGDPGQEYAEVQEYFDDVLSSMKTGGDIRKDKEMKFAGEQARFVDGTHLDDGVPLRTRLLLFKHGKRLFMIKYSQHEYGTKKSDAAWDVLLESFRFTK